MCNKQYATDVNADDVLNWFDACQIQRCFYDELLAIDNAFSGWSLFDGALVVRPFRSCRGTRGIVEWNDYALWKCLYSDAALRQVHCFARDILGTQYAIHEKEIVSFDPETGSLEAICHTIGDWIKVIREEPDYYSGYPLKETWEHKNGPVPAGSVLNPVIPFILGGEYCADNLYAMDELDSIRYHSNIAVQVRAIPDGTDVELEIE